MALSIQLQQQCQKSMSALQQSYQEILINWPKDILQQLEQVLPLSDFVFDSLQADKVLMAALPELLTDNDREAQYRQSLALRLSSCTNELELMHQLRLFRRQEMVIIAWRDCLLSHDATVNWDLEISLSHLSQLAEAMIFEAYQWQYQACCLEWGTPCNDEGQPQPMLIIGMGKLGGGELNFSSDIDLIFTYPENGQTQGQRRSIDNSQFFTRLGQRIIKSLDQPTLDGFCYRVDMRLRPFGESGPLVMSYAALEDYYQEQGRDWERYAMVKARVMGSEMYPQYQELRQMLRPFVFRRYIDFSAIQSLRRMKSMIRSEVRRRGLVNNIKLGAGGIREVEFIAQVFQLIRGGREPSLRGRGLLETLVAIDDLHLLEPGEVESLRQSYLFLRRLENLIQAIHDKQTQTLPDNSLDQDRLVCAMGAQSWAELMDTINHNMQQVHAIFVDLIGEDETQEQTVAPHFVEIWDMALQQDVVENILTTDLGIESAEELATVISQFKKDLAKKTLGQRGREVLVQLMPKIFETVLSHPDAQFGLSRVLHLLTKIVTRTTYLELLEAHAGALKQLIRLCTASPMISEMLGRYPILLDELIDPQQLYNPIALADYRSELRDFLARIPEDDMEQQMEALRQFKQICILKVAAADIAGVLPVMKVSDHLTYLSEAIMDAVVQQAWLQVSQKFGEPRHLVGRDGKGFAVIGYGKVGGWELGYDSDLDVVFLHDCPENITTDGAKEIDGRQFYLRLAQRIIHIFSVRTPSGILYDVDTRLRPSGASGLLACTAETFDEYQHKEAWTWEHQSLVRARMIYGDALLEQAFSQTRFTILSLEREQVKLKQEVADMRVKMRGHLGAKKAGRFMLKQDKGGITDVEFLVQYWVLQYSHQYPELTQWSDNVRILGVMAQQDLITVMQAEQLIEAYTTLRDEIHHRNLLKQDADVDESRFVDQRQCIQKQWQSWLPLTVES
ncbi:bifunctional [glutamate--ammonia ligase]-adenylyl-L-tyrosine phosphorylase/[glutamate--ammonia-ligase] adenylyltransferase [Vibrio sp. S17_S38]|uniref:bifunctional [glutamate--ammonia ligase]-adenylyl-L-tyrosine phosphorylase/[glutamate--ammonia-ligase] adenylyltransferase n=1 Tax=Vibrio sp. S17_S38 TaxID=2720229 RepID=UPI00167FE676|nr:bifunctional [glutamate--ammonia ligase]-adenylyl-L-tyrosine phosphorylase/[glutamate--ammonia-ligase] adenylyltransferase [Vibrio sp. S17_S38]MBD1574211.1 bifunctional [glutamate--ammonia ligase]-adenylyl-L-tyrosine phosphorylase/[glutamate--ammonia-ligase] adenylyltransferase [Vibrio sp. S17_S38]